jgi:cell division protease FtsH
MTRWKNDEIGREKILSVATHETGHAVLAWLSTSFKNVKTVTIKENAGTYGEVDWSKRRGPRREVDVIDEIAAYLAGIIAETLQGCKRTIGNNDDLKSATNLAKELVKEEGMGQKVGLRYIRKRELMSEWLQSRMDRDVSRILKKAEKLARRVLTKYAGEVAALAEILLERETVGPKELEEILGPKA